MNCGVLSVECIKMQSVKCGVWSVNCKVWGVECKKVECGV